ncbi:hypothetical protein EYF80_067142 [Liparis tanakae]|uniref:Uncharacterized protein n=1 Tax=Liparis tanakae TaxID=230148 RepID=A0A4Z2E1X4_9TELE|nr:hypothetical protein EYF80_067142 [Liparis tanakae]
MCDGEEESLERRYSAALNHLPDGHEGELEQGEEGGETLQFPPPFLCLLSDRCRAAAPSPMSEDDTLPSVGRVVHPTGENTAVESLLGYCLQFITTHFYDSVF